MTGSPSNPDLTNIFISFMLFQTQTSQTYFGVSDWLRGGDSKARGSVGLKLLLIHSILASFFHHVVLVQEAGWLEVFIAGVIRTIHGLRLGVHYGVGPEGLGLWVTL